MRRYVLLALSALVIAACGGETVESPTTTAPSATMTTSTTPTTARAETTTTTEPVTTTTAEPQIDVEIRDGEVTGRDRFEFGMGEEVSITVLSDTAYELHVHGYDLRFDLESGVPFTVEFIADVPGIFEVETHPDHLIVFEIEVGG